MSLNDGVSVRDEERKQRMRAASSALGYSAKATGIRGAASNVLRALVVSLWGRGTGAPRGRQVASRRVLGTLVGAFLLLLVASPFASAAKYFDSTVGVTSGSPAALGLTFASAPRDVAVNESSINDGNAAANGDFYVVDDANHRIQRLNANGTFDLAFGRDVIQAGKPGDLGDVFEVCVVAADCKAGVFGTTADALAGELDNPQGIAVDQDTGNVFVSNRDNRRIDVFTADGAFLRAFGFDVVSSGPGNTGVGYEVCVSANGDVCKPGLGVSSPSPTSPGVNPGQYSAGTTANGYRLDVSKPDGNPSTGKVYLANTGSRRVEVYNLDGSSPSNFGTTTEFAFSSSMLGVAVDAAGIVYANDAGQFIRRYDSSASKFLDAINLDALTGAQSTTGRSGFEVDRVTGNLFVTAASSTVGLLEVAAPGVVPSLVAVYPTAFTGSITPNGLGINPDTGKVYMPTSSNPAGTGTAVQRVVAFDEDGLSPIDVSVQPATAVQTTTATLHATINPAPNGPTGQATSYHFEVSKDGVSWTQVTPDTQVPPNGDTNADYAAQAVATGLEPNTLYRVRIVAKRANNSGGINSEELVFATDPAPPQTTTDGVSRVTDTTAQLNGRINPGGLPTSYWFEWGDDNYGNTTPNPAASAGTGSTPTTISQTIDNLAPNSVYHYRLCAQNQLATKTCGTDQTITTRTPIAAAPGRNYEMVTSPDKVLRRGGGQDILRFDTDYARLGPDAIPATDGESILWTIFGGVSDPNAGSGFAFDRGMEFRRREDRDGDGNADGWYGDAVVKVPTTVAASGTASDMYGVSADLQTQVWFHASSIFPAGNIDSTFVVGSTGGPLGAGWFPTAHPDWSTNPGVASAFQASPLIDDEGKRWFGTSVSNTGVTEEYRNLIPSDGGLSPDSLTPPQVSGGGLFMFGPPDWRPLDLVNECTGTLPGDSTRLPARGDAGTDAVAARGVGNLASNSATVTGVTTTNGAFAVGQRVEGRGIVQGTTITAVGAGTLTLSAASLPPGISGASLTAFSPALLEDDTIGDRLCAQGSPTDVRGATIGSETKDLSQSRLSGLASTAMSVDGDRAFFLSPDPTDVTPSEPPLGGRSCMDAAGAGTRCPAQLFVRQYDDEGDATVRWLSRAEDALFDAPQRIAALGSGVSFEGASRDGSVVYFRTDAPLTTDDPNGGISTVTGPAAANSWDLYRYELGDDNDADPAPAAGDPGDRLTRISGGPDGTADPNTNCPHVATSGPEAGNCATNVSPAGAAQTPNGGGGVVRFMSDDGNRVYFVTAAQIPGASNAPPAGGSTAPTAASAKANAETRNLYLYDATKTGPAAYEFIAQIPFGIDKFDLDACASFTSQQSGTPRRLAFRAEREANCVHGTSSGDAVAFETTGQLTPDDTDAVGDVYLYDTDADELTRLSAPAAGGTAPYVCLRNAGTNVVTAHCNGDLGASPQYPYDKVGLEGLRGMNIAEDDLGQLRAVYFESRHSLAVGAAVNDAMKVYEWRDGEVSLVSPAGSTDSAFYSGNGRDGRDVFFWTEQRISAWEIDSVDGDVYSATTRSDRIPGPPPPSVVCGVLSGGCQGGGGQPLAVSDETARGGDGGLERRARAQIAITPVGAKARRRAASAGTLALRVRVSDPGRVTATARARVRTRTREGAQVRRVAVARTTARAAGVVAVRLRLNAVARRELRSGRGLRLAVEVAKAGARSRTATVLLRRAGS